MKKPLLILLIVANSHALELSLDEAEKIALGENKPYLISLEEIVQYDQKRLMAYSKWFPQIRYNSFLAHTFEPSLVENINTATLFYKKNFFMNKFELTQTLFSSDNYFDIETSTLEKEAVEKKSQSDRNELLLNVRDRYYSIVLYNQALNIQKENVHYLTDALEIEQGRFDLGNSTSLNVNQSKVAVSNSISKYYNTLKSYNNSRNALVNYLGIEPAFEPELGVKDKCIPLDKVELVRKKLDVIKKKYKRSRAQFSTTCEYARNIDKITQDKHLTLFDDQELNELIDVAISKKPELKIQKLLVDLSNKKVSKAYGQYLPTVSGFVDYQKNSGEPGSRLFTKDPFSWAAGIKISWDIFDGLSRERKIKEAISKRISSKLSYRHALNTLELAIRNSLYQIEDALYAYLFATDSVKVAYQAMVQAKEQLKFGRVPPLDYRDAANQLAQAKNLQNQASYQVMMAYYQLRYDMGLDAKE